jgi:hypothetical protein
MIDDIIEDEFIDPELLSYSTRLLMVAISFFGKLRIVLCVVIFL